MTTIARAAALTAAALSLVVLSRSIPTHAQAPGARGTGTLVISGATLIDGHGGAPVPDSVVVVQGTRIAAVGRRGEVTLPAGARVVEATGKFVLPGLWDSQVSYSWYFGEAMLRHGITSTIDVGTNAETAVPHREAILHGKAVGPRPFTGISRIASVPSSQPGFETPLATIRRPSSPDDTRAIVRAFVQAGADYIIFYDGALPLEYYQAGADEAARLGKPVFARAYGPGMFPADAAAFGAAQLPHSAGVGVAVTTDPGRFKDGRDDGTELDRFAEMDDEKARALVRLLVERRVALVPTFMINYPGYPRDWARFTEEAKAFFTDPALRAYYPAGSIAAAMESYADVDQGDVRARRVRGFENVKRFHKMFADAGGRIVVSGNANDRWVPGLNLLHEMQVMAEIGLTPMQIIQGSTKFAAELIRKGDELGTIEAGKLADLIVVTKNPLEDIRHLYGVETVIVDGRVVDRRYHAAFRSPFDPPGSVMSPVVDGQQWAMALKRVTRRPRDPGHSPQPAIETMTPNTVSQGATATLVLKGFNFTRGSVVHFRGARVPSELVSPTELRVQLDGARLAAAGRFDVRVVNPAPIDAWVTHGKWGDGTSNAAHLIVDFRY